MKALSKYIFKIRTKTGVLVESLQISALNQEAAERNLKQMYVKCVILQVECQDAEATNASYEAVLDLIVKTT